MGRFVQLFSQKIDLKIFQSCLWWKKSQVKTISGLDAWLSYIRWYYASNGPALVCCSLVSWVIIFFSYFQLREDNNTTVSFERLGVVHCLRTSIHDWRYVVPYFRARDSAADLCDEQCWGVLFGRLWCHWLRSGSHIGKIQAGWFNECTAFFVFSLLNFY